MYVPPFESLLKVLNASKAALETDGTIAVPNRLVRLLLKIALEASDFDERSYLKVNPDVREAVRRGEIKNGRLHYIGFGYFEGRKGGMAKVDEEWYLRKYPDVADAVNEGLVASASAHFYFIGGGEGRMPNSECEGYVPPFECLLKSLNTSKAALETDGTIAVRNRLFKLLLKIPLEASDFDERSYLKANPDVREAVRRGEIKNGRLHYIGFGYFEGRKGGMAKVDEEWYLRKYPDVADAVNEGLVASASAHFYSIGGGEGRSPNSECEDDAAQWKRALLESAAGPDRPMHAHADRA